MLALEIRADPSLFVEMMPAQTFKLASPHGDLAVPHITLAVIPEFLMLMDGSRSKFVLRAWMHLSLSSVKARARRVRECEKLDQELSK